MDILSDLLFICLALSLAQDLHASSEILVIALRLLHLRQSVTQADVVIGAAYDFEWLCLIKGCNLAWLRREVVSWCSLLHLLDLSSQLVELV